MKKKILLAMPIKQSTVLPGISRALNYLGWDYHVFDYRNLKVSEKFLALSGQSDLATKLMNQRLIAAVKLWRPRLIFVVKGSVILPETIEAIKRFGTLTVNWFPDDIQAYDLAKNLVQQYDFFLHFDSRAINQLIKDTHVKNVLYFPFGADILPGDICPTGERRIYNLTMIGNYYPEREERLKVISNLGLHIWGEKKWEQTSLYKNYHHFLYYQDVDPTYRQTKIGLNIQFASPCWGLTNRIYEICRAGALVLTENRKELSNLFDVKKDIVVFQSDDQLKSLARYYLDNPKKREIIAKSGHKSVKEKHTYVHRFRQLFNTLGFSS